MFTPRGYTAVPQDVASQDEDEVVENNNLSRSFEQRNNWSGAKNTDTTMSTPRTSRESEEGETKERRAKRNVRFESRSMDDKPEPMSNGRRLCFVISLMICTLTIFVFAFTVPCKGPSCNVANMITTVTSNMEKFHRNWSMAFSGYSTGIVFHLSSTKTREVVVSYDGKKLMGKDLTRTHRTGKFEEKWNRKSAMQNKWNTKKSGLISLNEDNGKLLWLYNASDVMKLIECRTDDNDFETCLIQSSHGRLQLINPERNQIVWSTRILIGSILPSIIIGISDCDGDDGRDILLSYDRFNTSCIQPTNKTVCTHPGIVQLISGRTGYPLGSRLNIPQSHLIKRVSVHSTRQAENLIFVLTVGHKGHLKVISIQDLYREILDVRGGESPYLFKNSTVSVSDIVSTDHEPVVKDLNKDFVEDIILVTLSGNKHSLTAVDGGKLKKMWRIAFGSKKMLSQPVIGHFNDDEVPDILVILQDPMLSILNQSLVQILDGQNGNIMWSRKLRLAKNTTPLSANVGYKSDVFLLWIEKESKRKYQKIFPSKRAKDIEEQWIRTGQEINRKPEARKALEKASFDTRSAARKNVSDNSTQQQISKHRRSPRSVESREKMTSPVSDMETALDSLVDEIFVKDFKPTTDSHEKQNVKPHLEPKRMENTHKVLEDILKQEEEPSTGTERESHSHDGRPKIITRTKLPTQQPGLYDSPSTRMGQRVGQVTLNSHSRENNGRKPSPTTLNLATQGPALYDIHDLHIHPSGRVKYHQTVKHVMKNSADSEHNPVRNPSPTPNFAAHTSLPTVHSETHTNARVITKEPRLVHLLNDNKETNEKHTIPATTKPSAKLSHRKRVEEFIINNPGSGIDEGNASNITTPMIGSHDIDDVKLSRAGTLQIRRYLDTHNKFQDVTQEKSTTKTDQATIDNTDSVGNNRRQTLTTTLTTERSLDTRNKIHETTTQEQKKTKASQATTDNADTDGNDRRQTQTSTLRTQNKIRHVSQFVAKTSREAAIEDRNHDGRRQTPTGTFTPELYVSSQSKPTTKMINSRNVEDIVIPGNNHDNDAIQNPTVTALPPTRPGSQPADMQMKKSLPITKLASSGIVEEVRIQNHVRESNIDQGAFSTTKHISSKVPSSSPHEHNRKTISENIDNDNMKSTEKSFVSDVDSVPGRVLAPRPGFTLPAAKSTKTTRPISDTSSVHAHEDHHIPITIEGMTDMKTENTQDKIRAGKDVIVMPTKPPVTRLPTGENLQKSTQQKRHIDYRTTRTTTQQQQDTNANTYKRLRGINEPTQTRANNSTLSDDGNKQLDLDNTNMIRNVITTTSASPSQGVHKNNPDISDTKPSTKPQRLSEINHTEIPAKKPKKESNALSTLGKSNLRTKLKLRDSVLLNAGTKKVNVDDDGTKNSHTSHPVKLNGTGRLDENKAVEEKKQKSNQSETLQRQPLQAVNTTKSHPSKLGNTHHPTTRSHVTSSKKNHHVECHKGSDLALIAIFPDSQKNTFTVISQENSIRNTKKGFSKPSSCHTLWPTLKSNPLVHDADSDGFLEIIYAVNYGEDAPIDRAMKVRKFSIKVDSDD